MGTTTAKATKTTKVNRIGLQSSEYRGAHSTLCKGCGHESITSQLIKALYEVDVPPHLVAKLSGIGCSSKTITYFLNRSHGFNAVHGRMAAIAAGVGLANRKLIKIGISGDGDTASIGMGHFVHMVRRNVDIVYIIENNGVYGLTKGQFSATADKGSVQKSGAVNPMDPIDCCALAIEMGCQYVARSFSGDPKQLLALLKGALSHKGTAILDVVSPCVTFNNHEGSTKSYSFAKEHEEEIHSVGYVPYYDEIRLEYRPGEVRAIDLPDGARIILKKLDRDFDPTDKAQAIKLLWESRKHRQFLTGLLYHGAEYPPMTDQQNLVEEPLVSLPDDMLRPSPEVLEEIIESFR